jgi:hypothetical protein
MRKAAPPPAPPAIAPMFELFGDGSEPPAGRAVSVGEEEEEVADDVALLRVVGEVRDSVENGVDASVDELGVTVASAVDVGVEVSELVVVYVQSVFIDIGIELNAAANN